MRWVVIAVFVALFALGLLWARMTGSEFLPALDDGRVMVKLKMPAGTAVAETDGAPGTSVGEAQSLAERAVASLTRPAGVSFAMGGQALMMAENNRTMRTILFFAVLFAYVVLAIQFNSYVLPVLAMLGIPLALTGAFGALYAFGEPA